MSNEDKLEIKVLDIRNIAFDIKTLTIDNINAFFTDYTERNAIIHLNSMYKSPLFNFLTKSNIESINIRNLAILDGVIPIISKTIRNAIIGVRFLEDKLCIKNGLWVRIPENTDVNIKELYLGDMEINMDSIKTDTVYEDFTTTQTEVDEKFVAAMGQVLNYYLSNAYNFLNSSFIDYPKYDENVLEIGDEEQYEEEKGRDYEKLKKLIKLLYDLDIKSTEAGLFMLVNNFHLYKYALTDGVESEQIKEYIEKTKKMEDTRNKIVEANRKLLAEQNKEKMLQHIALTKFKKDFDELSKPEIKIATTEYEMIQNLIKNSRNNTCEHLKVLNDMYAFMSRENFDKLSNLLDKQSVADDGYYMCKRCQFSVICPHKYVKILSDIEMWPYEKLERAMYKFLFPIKFTNYCKICGEDIMPVSNSIDAILEPDDETKLLIWKAVMQAFNLFTFKVSENPKRLAQDAINLIMPQIGSDLEGVIYSYAFVLDYYIESKNLILAGSSRKEKGDKKDKREKSTEELSNMSVSDIAKLLVNDLKIKNFDIIRGMSNIEIDAINGDFLLAYKKLKGNSEFVERDSVKELINSVVNSTDYQFACVVAIMDGKKPTFELITGRKVDDYIKYCESLYKNSRIIDIVRYHKYEDNMYFALKEFDVLNAYYKTNGNSLIHDAYKQYLYFATKVDTQIKFDEYMQNLKVDKKPYSTAWFCGNQNIKIANNQYKLENILYSNVYDENGEKHVWKGDECKICNINKFETNKLDNDKIVKIIQTKLQIRSFFIYYTFNCPVDDKHVLPCKKCGLKEIDFSAPDMEYYNKHIDDYLKMKYNQKINEPEKYVPQKMEYEYNYTTIIKLVEMMSSNTKTIHCLGLVNNILYNSFNEDDKVEYESQDSRFYIALMLLSQVIFVYNQMKNIMHLSNIDPFLIDRKHVKLRDIDLDYVKLCSDAIILLNKDLVMKFIHEHICKFFMFVFDQDKEFARDLFNYMVENNKSLAKQERNIMLADEDIEEHDDVGNFDTEKDILMDDGEIEDTEDIEPSGETDD